MKYLIQKLKTLFTSQLEKFKTNSSDETLINDDDFPFKLELIVLNDGSHQINIEIDLNDPKMPEHLASILHSIENNDLIKNILDILVSSFGQEMLPILQETQKYSEELNFSDPNKIKPLISPLNIIK